MCAKHAVVEQPGLSRKAMSEFYHDVSMQALSKRNREKLLNFDAICELAMTIKYILQKQTYASIMEGQQMRNVAFEIENEIDYVEEKTAKLKILEQGVADAIIENRKIEYQTDEYYKTHYMPQTEQEIKEEKEQKDSDFLQTATEYY